MPEKHAITEIAKPYIVTSVMVVFSAIFKFTIDIQKGSRPTLFDVFAFFVTSSFVAFVSLAVFNLFGYKISFPMAMVLLWAGVVSPYAHIKLREASITIIDVLSEALKAMGRNLAKRISNLWK